MSQFTDPKSVFYNYKCPGKKCWNTRNNKDTNIPDLEWKCNCKMINIFSDNLPYGYHVFLRLRYSLSKLVSDSYKLTNIKKKQIISTNEENKKDYLNLLKFHPEFNEDIVIKLDLVEFVTTTKNKVKSIFGLLDGTYEFTFDDKIPIYLHSISKLNPDHSVINEESRILNQYVLQVCESDLKNYQGDLMSDFGTFINKFYLKYKYNSEFSEDTSYTIYQNNDMHWDHNQNQEEHRSFNTLYLPKNMKDEIIEDIENFRDPLIKERYKKLGRKYKRIICLEGIPGTGKTSLITACASYFNYDIAIITPSIGSKFTDLTFKCLLSNLPRNDDSDDDVKPAMLVFEDMDALFDQNRNSDAGKHAHTFSGLLNGLDGIGTPSGLICFITTNNFKSFDPALKRRGRIDKVYHFGHMVEEQFYDMYKNFMEEKFTEEEFKSFYDKFNELNIKVTVSTMQEYLFQYFDEPEKAKDNLKELKNMNKNISNNVAYSMYA